jgi:hypothetical protein
MAGERPGRARTQAIPLPSEATRTPGPGKVRACDAVRGGASRVAHPRGVRHEARRHAEEEGACYYREPP